MLHDVQAGGGGTPDGRGMHFMSLNVQQSLRPKIRALCSPNQSFSFPDSISLQEIGALPESFSIHSLYASFFSLTNRKCLGVAVLIRCNDSYAFHRVDIRADGGGVAVWFSLAAALLLVIGLYLPASGPTEAYEPILQWAPRPGEGGGHGGWLTPVGGRMRSWSRSAPRWCGQLPREIGGRYGLGHPRSLAGSPTWGPLQGGPNGASPGARAWAG